MKFPKIKCSYEIEALTQDIYTIKLEKNIQRD